MKKKVVLLGFLLLAANVVLAADAIVVFRPSNANWYGSHTQPSPVFLSGLTTTTIGWGWALGAPNQVPLLGDVNGDGIDDITLLQVASGNYNWVAGHSTVSGGVGSFSSATTSGITNFGTAAGSLGSFLADVNGDGKKDAVTVNAGNAWYAQCSTTGLGGGAFYGPAYFTNLYSTAPVANGGTQVGDFDGDGRADMCFVTNWDGWNCRWIIQKTSGGVLGAGAQVDAFFGYVDGTFLSGDINGDGRDDGICVRPDGAGGLNWTVKYADSNGMIGGLTVPVTPDTSHDFGLTGDVPFVADINNDGKNDIGVIRTSNISGAMFRYVSFTTSGGTLTGTVDDTQSFGTAGDVALVGKLGTAPAVSATNCVYALFGDYNGDCIVNLTDFAVMAKRWAIDCIATPSNPECVVPNY